MRYREEAFEHEEEGCDVDREGDAGHDDLRRGTARREGETGEEETEEEISPCPMCGGRHKGSYCQMPPHEIDYVS